MTSTTETGNVSQQPECLGEKRYEVILDFGKPSSEKVATLGEVAALLKVGYDLFQEEGTGDVQVFDNGFDVTDSQVIQEMIAEIMEGEPAPQCKLYPEAKCCPDMCEAGEKVACGLDPGFPEEDHDIHVEEAQLEAMEEEGFDSSPEEVDIYDDRAIMDMAAEVVAEKRALLSKKQSELTKEGLSEEYVKKIEGLDKAGLSKELSKLEKDLDVAQSSQEVEAINQAMDFVEGRFKAFPTCTYGDGLATSKCAGCGKPLCGTCGYKLGDDRLCNACFELDPR